MGIQDRAEGLIWALPQCIELGLEALQRGVSDSIRPELASPCVTGLPMREDLPLLTVLENEGAKGMVSLHSHPPSRMVQVELRSELSSCGTRHANHPLDSI